MDYRQRFKSCGQNVIIDANVFIETPELFEVGDDVHFYPNCYVQGVGKVTVADHVEFFPGTYISTGDAKSFIDIGHHTHFAPYCVLYGWGGLTIGPYCNIAAHCVFATIGHDPVMRGDKPMAIPPYVAGPITLEEDIWLGANVTITSNVTIARGCIIGANAIVNRSTEPYGLYCGVPARRVRDRKKA
jgi:acetyltransferase-like isoleucine patch superfamily enzyme